jgi:hypothetical protein
MKILRKRGEVNGSDTNESIAYLQNISIGMNQGGLILRFALSSMTHFHLQRICFVLTSFCFCRIMLAAELKVVDHFSLTVIWYVASCLENL